jgi:hypothetical protein
MPDWAVEKSHSGLPSSGQPLRIRPQAVFFLRLAVNGVLFLSPICDNVGDGLVSLFGPSLGLNGVWPCFLKKGEIDVDLKELSERSAAIRAAYHALEREYHGSEWSVEEDALAFLTDAGLVGRLTMSHEGRWPSDEEGKLPSKIGECVWWLAVLTDRTGLDFADCVQQFLADTEQALK